MDEVITPRSPLICVYIAINIKFKDIPVPVATASYKNLDKVFNNSVKIVLVHWPPEHRVRVLVCSSWERPLTSVLPQKTFSGKLSRMSRKPGPLWKLQRQMWRSGENETAAENVRLSTLPTIFTANVNIWWSLWLGNLFSSYTIRRS